MVNAKMEDSGKAETGPGASADAANAATSSGATKKVSIKFGTKEVENLEISFTEAEFEAYTLAELQQKVEEERGVPIAKQDWMCKGRKLRGIAWVPEKTTMKDIDKKAGASLVLMCMGVDVEGLKYLSECERKAGEAEAGNLSLHQADIMEMSEKMDCLQLAGPNRSRRKELLIRLDKLEGR